MQPISPSAAGVLLRLRIQPTASRDEVTGVMGDSIKVRLAAPPVDGAANEALVDLLASRLRVPRSAVELVSGRQGRIKLVSVKGLSVDEAAQRLLQESLAAGCNPANLK